MDGDVQFRTFIQHSHGFAKKGELWIPEVLHVFARYALVIFIAGFNDSTDDLEQQSAVRQAVDEHVR